MIEELHNILDTILGLNNLNVEENEFTLSIINEYSYFIELKDNSNNIVSASKDESNLILTYSLPTGNYYLRVYINKEKEKQIYYEEIKVFNNMKDTYRSIDIR